MHFLILLTCDDDNDDTMCLRKHACVGSLLDCQAFAYVHIWSLHGVTRGKASFWHEIAYVYIF